MTMASSMPSVISGRYKNIMRLINKIFGKSSPLYKRIEDIDIAALQQIIDDVENKN